MVAHEGHDMSAHSAPAAASTATSSHGTMSSWFSLYAESWTPSSAGTYAGICIFLIVLAIILRALFTAKSYLDAKAIESAVKRRYVVVEEGVCPEKIAADGDSMTGTAMPLPAGISHRELYILRRNRLIRFLQIQSAVGHLYSNISRRPISPGYELLVKSQLYMFKIIRKHGCQWIHGVLKNLREDYPCELAYPNECYEPFWQKTCGYVNQTLDEGLSVQQVIQGLWLMFIEAIRPLQGTTNRPRNETTRAWEDLSHARKELFLTTFEFDDRAMLKLLTEISHRQIESAQDRQSEKYLTELAKLPPTVTRDGSRRHYFAGLGREIRQVHNTKLIWGAIKHTMRQECHQKRPIGVVNARPVTNKADLTEKDCPVCFDKFIIAPAILREHEVRPAKLVCGHLVCYGCCLTWLGEGAATCPLCRSDIQQPRYMPIEQVFGWFAKGPLYGARYGPHGWESVQTPQEAAEAMIFGFNKFLSYIPEEIRESARLSILDQNMDTYRNIVLGPSTEKLMDWLRQTTPRNHQQQRWENDSEYRVTLAYMFCLWDRLKAYLNEDVEGYREAVVREMQLVGYIQSARFAEVFMICNKELASNMGVDYANEAL